MNKFKSVGEIFSYVRKHEEVFNFLPRELVLSAEEYKLVHEFVEKHAMITCTLTNLKFLGVRLVLENPDG